MEKLLLSLQELRSEFKQFFTSNAAAADKAKSDAEKIKSLETELVTAKATITELQGKIATAETAVTAKDTEIKTLTEKVAGETKRTDEVLAGMGIDPKNIPSGKPGPTAENNVWARHDKLKGEEQRQFRLANWEQLRQTPRPGNA